MHSEPVNFQGLVLSTMVGRKNYLNHSLINTKDLLGLLLKTECTCYFFLAVSMEKESEAATTSRPSIVEKPPLSSVSVKRQVGCSEDYLLSKMPSDGREVPFVVPPFKLAYIQPKSLGSSSHIGGIEGKLKINYSEIPKQSAE